MTLFLMLEIQEGKGWCIEGYLCKSCIGSSEVCRGCSAVRVVLLEQWWRRGSAESEGRLKVPHADNVQPNLNTKIRN